MPKKVATLGDQTTFLWVFYLLKIHISYIWNPKATFFGSHGFKTKNDRVYYFKDSLIGLLTLEQGEEKIFDLNPAMCCVDTMSGFPISFWSG